MARHLRLTLPGHDCQPFCIVLVRTRGGMTLVQPVSRLPHIRCRVAWKKARLVPYSSYTELCRVNECWRSGRIHDSSHANSFNPFCVLVVVVGRNLSWGMYGAVVSSPEGYQARPACKTLAKRTSTRWSRRTNCRREY